jgi:hypothetical protein
MLIGYASDFRENMHGVHNSALCEPYFLQGVTKLSQVSDYFECMYTAPFIYLILI